MFLETKDRTYYSDSFKLRIIQEVLSGKITKEAARSKYGIKGHSAILNWMRKFKITEPIKQTVILKSANDFNDKQALEHRLKALEKALEQAEFKAAAYSKMIDIAEDQFKIPIRKKLSTKRLKR